jgi:hypothetical protein
MMNAELIPYFTAERNGAIFLLCMGVVSLVAAYVLWQSKSAFIAMIWPLVFLGAFEIIIGSSVALRTPSQVQQLETGIENDARATVSEELTRMERINRNFRIVKVAEVVFIGIGIAAVLLLPIGTTWYSIALGLIIHSAALLVFDSFAHHRAQVYVEWLQSL